MTLNNERLTEQILLFFIVKVPLQQNQQNNDFLKTGDKNHTFFFYFVNGQYWPTPDEVNNIRTH